jgi:hypothetical protein
VDILATGPYANQVFAVDNGKVQEVIDSITAELGKMTDNELEHTFDDALNFLNSGSSAEFANKCHDAKGQFCETAQNAKTGKIRNLYEKYKNRVSGLAKANVGLAVASASVALMNPGIREAIMQRSPIPMAFLGAAVLGKMYKFIEEETKRPIA